MASQVGHAAAAVRWHLGNAERFPAMCKARLADARSVRWRRETNSMQIRIEGTDLPGRSCGPSAAAPDGYRNIHVGVQRRGKRDELLGLTLGDAPAATWTIECQLSGDTDPNGFAADVKARTFKARQAVASSPELGYRRRRRHGKALPPCQAVARRGAASGAQRGWQDRPAHRSAGPDRLQGQSDLLRRSAADHSMVSPLTCQADPYLAAASVCAGFARVCNGTRCVMISSDATVLAASSRSPSQSPPFTAAGLPAARASVPTHVHRSGVARRRSR
jgi:Family of unknown function (DUF5990)